MSPTADSTRDFGVGSFRPVSLASGLGGGTDNKRDLYLIVNVRYGVIIAQPRWAVNSPGHDFLIILYTKFSPCIASGAALY